MFWPVMKSYCCANTFYWFSRPAFCIMQRYVLCFSSSLCLNVWLAEPYGPDFDGDNARIFGEVFPLDCHGLPRTVSVAALSGASW